MFLLRCLDVSIATYLHLFCRQFIILCKKQFSYASRLLLSTLHSHDTFLTHKAYLIGIRAHLIDGTILSELIIRTISDLMINTFLVYQSD